MLLLSVELGRQFGLLREVSEGGLVDTWLKRSAADVMVRRAPGGGRVRGGCPGAAMMGTDDVW